MTVQDPIERLEALGFDLGRALHLPAGSYRNVVVSDGLAYVAGHGPLLDGKPKYRGKVPSQVSIEEGYEAARLTAGTVSPVSMRSSVRLIASSAASSCSAW